MFTPLNKPYTGGKPCLNKRTLDQDELKQPGLAPPIKGDWNATLGLGIGTDPKFEQKNLDRPDTEPYFE
jgi:hypothetical protein